MRILVRGVAERHRGRERRAAVDPIWRGGSLRSLPGQPSAGRRKPSSTIELRSRTCCGRLELRVEIGDARSVACAMSSGSAQADHRDGSGSSSGADIAARGCAGHARSRTARPAAAFADVSCATCVLAATCQARSLARLGGRWRPRRYDLISGALAAASSVDELQEGRRRPPRRAPVSGRLPVLGRSKRLGRRARRRTRHEDAQHVLTAGS